MTKKYDGINLYFDENDETISYIADIFRRRISKKSGPYLVFYQVDKNNTLDIEFKIESSIPEEGYCIKDISENKIEISASGPRGI
ncbi:MAG: hypothetical protein ACYTFY_07355 [Planctomycetota bacterium]|jgi:hypothetical protein